MIYSEIQDRLNEIAKKPQYEFSRENFLDLELVDTLLNNGIGVSEVTLTELHVIPAEGVLEGNAAGITILGIFYPQIRLKFVFRESDQTLQLDMEFSWDGKEPCPVGGISGRFTFTDLVCTCCATDGEVMVTWEYSGHMRLSGDNVPVSLWYVAGSDYIFLQMAEDEEERLSLALADALALFGIEGADSLMPKDLADMLRTVTICDFSFTYDNSRDAFERMSVKFAFENVGWKPTGSFAAVLSGLQLEASPDRGGQAKLQWSAGVSGDVCLENVRIPIYLGYISQGNQIWASVGGDESVLLGDLSSLAQFVETSHIDTGVLPFRSASFYLNNLLMDYSVDNGKMSEFHIELSVREVWKLLDLFEVKELVFGIQMRDTVAYRLGGTFRLFGLSFALEAYHETGNWKVEGYTLEDTGISLSTLASVLTGNALAMPDFTLSDLRISCASSDSAYAVSAMVSEAARFAFEKSQNQFYVQINLADTFQFSSLPFVGGTVQELDQVSLGQIIFFYSDGLSPQGQILPRGLIISADFILPNETQKLIIPLYAPGQSKSQDEVSYGRTETASDKAFHGSVHINKSIGPFYIYKLLFSYITGQISLGISAAFLTGGMSLSLDELMFCCDTGKHKLTASLAGLSLSFSSGSFSIEGGFVRKDAEAESYEGSLRVQAGIYGLTLLGAYAAKPYPSAFLFGMVRGRIGGPPCFLITGIAAGFGYARSLVIPSVENLEDFSLMAVVTGKRSADTILKDADRDFPAKSGSYWIVAGITANSFQMVDMAVLAAVTLDGGFRLDLLGRADITVPKGAQDPIAKVGLLVKVTIDPRSGLIPVDGVLSADSYVISRDCHISGGFAFYLWYGGGHAGDFVISLGGYANKYTRPAHYPAPDRLKLSWKLSNELSVEGSLYFALTPSCVMAGGDLQMVFQWKRVYAWFHAYVDIMIGWKPYNYASDIGISLGVKVDLALFTVKVELGCNLSIWGPEFSGIAEIKLWVISFSIRFGNGIKKDDPISVTEFKTSFLPSANHKSNAAGAENDEQYGGVSINFAKGVIGELHQNGSEQTDEGIKIVCAQTLELVIKSQVPLVSLDYNDQEVEAPSIGETQRIYLRPCEKEAAPKLFVAIKRQDGVPIQSEFIVQPVTEKVPAALWERKGQNTDETKTAYTGLSVSMEKGIPYRSLTCVLAGRIEENEYKLNSPPELTSKNYDQSKAYDILDDIDSTEIRTRRENFVKSLHGNFAQSIDLSGFAPRSLFDAQPVLVETGGEYRG